jgi:MoaA/NifB/PqqE/SkfB family radical SAM enzyme
MAVWPWAEKLWAHAEQAGQLIFAYFLVVCVHDWHETEKPQPLQYEYEALLQAAKKKNTHTHTHILYIYTSSTAQGGGGSFKNRKPIGKVGCCESGKAARSR